MPYQVHTVLVASLLLILSPEVSLRLTEPVIPISSFEHDKISVRCQNDRKKVQTKYAVSDNMCWCQSLLSEVGWFRK